MTDVGSQRARVVVLTGPSGSGKSRLAGRLNERRGWPIFRLDDFYREGNDPDLPHRPGLGIPDWDDPRSWNGAMLGASGAIFGIYVSFAYLFPNQVIRLLFPPVAMKAKYFVLIMAVLELFYGVRGYSTGVAHFAHLGGALFGFLLIMYWYKGRLR